MDLTNNYSLLDAIINSDPDPLSHDFDMNDINFDDMVENENKNNKTRVDTDEASINEIVRRQQEYETAKTDELWNLIANDNKLIDHPITYTEFKDESEYPTKNANETPPDSDYDNSYVNSAHFSYNPPTYNYEHNNNEYSAEEPRKENTNNNHNKYQNEQQTQQTQQTQQSGYQSDYRGHKFKPNIYGGVYNERTGEYVFPSKDDELFAKLNVLRQLGSYAKRGGKLSRNWSLEDSFKAMLYELEIIKGIKQEENTVKWMKGAFTTIVWGLELGNKAINPFDIDLEGFSQHVDRNIDEYDDIFTELYEKYNKDGKGMSVELRFLMMFGGSLIQYSLQKKMLGSFGGLGDMLNDNPSINNILSAMTGNEQQKQTFADKKYAEMQQRMDDMEIIRKHKEEQENIKNKEQELERRIFEGQQKLRELQNQLDMVRSESQSIYSPVSKMSHFSQPPLKPPVMPPNLMQQQQNTYYQNLQYMNQNPYNNMTPIQMDQFRQQSVQNQMQEMIKKEKENNIIETRSHDGETKISRRSNADAIIANKIRKDSDKEPDIDVIDFGSLESETQKLLRKSIF